MNVSTLVFFDIETTGLPHEERNQTKITELSFVAVSVHDVESTQHGAVPLVNKLSLLFNPQRKISSKAQELSTLSNALLSRQTVFKEKIKTINSFLEGFPPPVCLIAHNGNRFDFKMLVTEYNDTNSTLPPHILCVDSLIGFRKILKDKYIDNSSNEEKVKPICTSSPNSSIAEIMTDDEEDWPVLNASSEEWDEIDRLIISTSNLSCSDSKKAKLHTPVSRKSSKDSRNVSKEKEQKEKICYTQGDLYRRLLKKEPVNAHRAEADCTMLLECVVATKSEFLPWVNVSCQPLRNIKPYERYTNRY